MIKDPITITVLNSYDVGTWEKELIVRCAQDNPESGIEDLAKRLGLTGRTLYRKMNQYNIRLRKRGYYRAA